MGNAMIVRRRGAGSKSPSTGTQHLYKYGDECINLSGGWSAKAWARSSNYKPMTPVVTKGNSSMTVALSGSNSAYTSGAAHMVKDVDMSNHSRLVVKFASITAAGTLNSDNYSVLYVLALNRNVQYTNQSAAESTERFTTSRTVTEYEIAVDISALSGVYDVAIGISQIIASSSAKVTAVISEIRLE